MDNYKPLKIKGFRAFCDDRRKETSASSEQLTEANIPALAILINRLRTQSRKVTRSKTIESKLDANAELLTTVGYIGLHNAYMANSSRPKR